MIWLVLLILQYVNKIDIYDDLYDCMIHDEAVTGNGRKLPTLMQMLMFS